MSVDAELVEQIRHGNREAYGELFRKYHAQIYSLCLSILNNPQDAAEIAQEIFIHAYLKLDRLRKSDSFFPWLKKIAQNRSRDFVRQAGQQAVLLDLRSEYATTTTPDEQLLRQELIDIIMEAIEALPIRDREVIQARIEGMNHAEISRRFGISVGASMSRLYRVRKKLAHRVRDSLHGIFGLLAAHGLKRIILGGVTAVRVGIAAKITVGTICALTAGYIGLQIGTYSPDAESPESAGQQPEVKSESSSGVVLRTRSPRIFQHRGKDQGSAQGERDVPDEESAEAPARLDELGAEPQIETAESEASEKPEKRVESAEEWRRRIEELRRKTEEEAMQIPVLVQQWKDVMARKNSLGKLMEDGARMLTTDAERQEFDRLQDERNAIMLQITTLAMSYDSVHREENALSYPDGWIGQLAHEVGINFGTPR